MIIQTLEKIATNLEKRGMIREAKEIDVVCNTVEANENVQKLVDMINQYGIPDEKTFNEIKQDAVQMQRTAAMPKALKKTIGCSFVALIAALSGKSVSDIKYNDLIDTLKNNPQVVKNLETKVAISVKEKEAEPHIYYDIEGYVYLDRHILDKVTDRARSIGEAEEKAQNIINELKSKYDVTQVTPLNKAKDFQNIKSAGQDKESPRLPWTNPKIDDMGELKKLIGDRVKNDPAFLANKIGIVDNTKNPPMPDENRFRTKIPPKEFKEKFVKGPDGYWYLQDIDGLSVVINPGQKNLVLYDDSKDHGSEIEGLEPVTYKEI